MYNEGLSPSASALSETTADAMFEGGQLAMNFAGSYMVPEYASNDAIKDKVDCVEIPTFNGKKTTASTDLDMQCLKEARTKKQQKISLSGLEVKKLRKSRENRCCNLCKNRCTEMLCRS